MALVQLSINGISYSQTQTGAYALVLGELDGSRTLPIIIGAFEAQSIAIALEQDIKTPRPLTHDLFKSFADTFKVNLNKVIIHKLLDGVFYSSLVCEYNGETAYIDARTSDAIALSVRFDAPIFTNINILDKAGIYLSSDTDIDSDIEGVTNDDLGLNELDFEVELEVELSSKEISDYSDFTSTQLEEELNKAIEDEDYELAAKIRDEISKR